VVGLRKFSLFALISALVFSAGLSPAAAQTSDSTPPASTARGSSWRTLVSSAPTLLTVGTINLILLIDGCLTRAALVNAVITTTEAKTLALNEGGTRTREGSPATGTSTAAIVIACTGRGEPLCYAGTATEVGWLIGRAVRGVVQETMALIR